MFMAIDNRFDQRCEAFLISVADRLGNDIYEDLRERVSYAQLLTDEMAAVRMLRAEMLWLGALRPWQNEAWQAEAQPFVGWNPVDLLHGDGPIDGLVFRFQELRLLMLRAHPPTPQQIGGGAAMHWPIAQHGRIARELKG